MKFYWRDAVVPIVVAVVVGTAGALIAGNRSLYVTMPLLLVFGLIYGEMRRRRRARASGGDNLS